MGKFNLSETESEVMEFFWNRKGKFAFGEIYDYFKNEKNKIWKKQTLQTYITHLIKKGVLVSEKKGNMYLYFLKVTKEEHIKNWTKDFLDKTFQGSIKKFLFALGGNEKLDDKTIAELKEFLRENNEIE